MSFLLQRRLVLSLLTGLLLSAPLSAVELTRQPDETTPRFTAGQVMDWNGALDQVSIFGGDVQLSVPLSPEYVLGPWTKFRAVASYSGKLWYQYKKECPIANPTCPGFPIYAGRAHLAGMYHMGTGWFWHPGIVSPTDSTGGVPAWKMQLYDGSSHKFTGILPTLYSNDATYIRMRQQGDGSFFVDLPDGHVLGFTHKAYMPLPPNGYDFQDIERGQPQQTGWGLSWMKDPYGTTVLEVQYASSFPAQDAWKPTAIVLNQSAARTLTIQWGTYFASDSSQFPVVTGLTSPATVGTQQTTFAYKPSGRFERSYFDDATWEQQNCPGAGPRMIDAPFLDTVTIGTDVYRFDYSLGYVSPGNGSNGRGYLTGYTLPTGGHVDFAWQSYTAHDACVIPRIAGLSGCDHPETSSPEEAPVPPRIQYSECTEAASFGRYLDSSPAVIQRTETDPTVSQPASITTYTRDQFAENLHVWQQAGPIEIDPLRYIRRVVVRRPDGNGGTVSTKHLFQVGVSGYPSGLELERRTYAGTSTSGTPLRTVISCHETQGATQIACGSANPSDGTIPYLDVKGYDRRTREITWYGVNAPGGGSCSQAVPNTTACLERSFTDWDNAASEYKLETVTIPQSWPSFALAEQEWLKRETKKIFNPAVDAVTYLPKRLGQVKTQDFFVCSTDLPCLAQRTCPTEPCETTGDLFYNLPGKPAFVTEAKQYAPAYEDGSTWSHLFSPDAYGNPAVETAKGTGLVEATLIETNRVFSNGQVTSAERVGLQVPWKRFDVVRSAATGLITSSADPNLLATTYSYDARGRLTAIDPPGSPGTNPPGEETTTVAYISYVVGTPAHVIVKKGAGVGASSSTSVSNVPYEGSGTAEVYVFDGFGKMVREIRLLPNRPNGLSSGSYLAVRETRYNEIGAKTWISEWTPCGTSWGELDAKSCFATTTLKGSSSSNFDVFGRARYVTAADGRQTKLSFDDLAANVPNSDHATWTWTERQPGSWTLQATRRNPFGKLFIISDPEYDMPQVAVSSTAVNALATYAKTTSHFWNVLDKLGKVLQKRSIQLNPPPAPPSDVTQIRTFVYSSLGLLRSESHPERSPTTYALYDALGNPKTIFDADVTLSKTYDAAGRLLSIASGADTYLENTYDAYIPDGSGPEARTAGGLYPKGRLVRQVGKNPGALDNHEIWDDYVYSDPSGRLSTKDTVVKQAGNFTWLLRATQSFSYDSMGFVKDFTRGGWRPASSPTLVESRYYRAGQLTRIAAGGSDVLSSATYNAPGGLRTYSAANGVVTTLDDDPNLMARPSRIRATKGAATLFDTGLFSFDGAGNITAMGSDNFNYDVQSRLASSSVTENGYTYWDSFIYDDFQNQTEHVAGTIPGSAASFLFDTWPDTNRLKGAGYDARGNMTSYDDVQQPFGTDYFSYDALSRQTKFGKSLGVSQEEYLYDGSGERLVRVGAQFLQITTTSLPRGTAGTFYFQSLQASGGLLPLTWTVASGNLPPGVTLSTNGILSGTPTKSGIFVFTVQVQDSENPTQYASCAFTLNVVDGLKYFTVSPCRLYDSREAGAGGPLLGGQTKTIASFGLCGIPSNAKVLSANLTTTQWVTSFNKQRRLVSLFPTGVPLPSVPPVSGTVYGQGDRATMAMPNIAGPTAGSFTISSDLLAGESVHVIVDVNGYFAPTGPWSAKDEADATSGAKPTALSPVVGSSIFTPLATNGVWYFTIRNGEKKPILDYKAQNQGASPQLQRDSIYLGSFLLATYHSDTATPYWRYYSSDHLGTPRIETDAAGNLVTKRKYRPYGLNLDVFNTTGVPRSLGFAGMERDGSNIANQSFFNHARQMSAWTGRFQSVDAVNGRPENPASWNRYSYTRNNPLRFVDPDGKLIQVAPGNQAADVRSMLVQVLQRPSGRAALMALAEHPTFTTTFESKEITGRATIGSLLRTRSRVELIFGFTQYGADSKKQATVALDTYAIQAIGHDRTGTTTTAHEIYHARDFQAQKPGTEIIKGDQPSSADGPAEQFGAKVASEKPDLTKAEAERILKELLKPTGSQ